jgi:hypothetical protein
MHVQQDTEKPYAATLHKMAAAAAVHLGMRAVQAAAAAVADTAAVTGCAISHLSAALNATHQESTTAAAAAAVPL